jgi:hypothetical protein
MRIYDLRSQLKWYSCEGTHIGVSHSFNDIKILWKSSADSCWNVYNSKHMEEIKHCRIYEVQLQLQLPRFKSPQVSLVQNRPRERMKREPIAKYSRSRSQQDSTHISYQCSSFRIQCLIPKAGPFAWKRGSHLWE